MDTDSPTEAKLIEIIAERLDWPMDAGSSRPDTPIGEDGLGLDSLMVVELALDIEEQFGLVVDDGEILSLGGMTLGEVATFIEERAATAS